MNYADKLRSDALEQRQAAGDMLKAIESGPQQLRQKLVSAESHSRLEAMRAEIRSIAESLPQSSEQRRLVAVVSGIVTANVLDALADLAEYFVASGALKRVGERLREQREFQQAIRFAVAEGNWDEFDRIVERLAGRDGGGERPQTPVGDSPSSSDGGG